MRGPSQQDEGYLRKLAEAYERNGLSLLAAEVRKEIADMCVDSLVRKPRKHQEPVPVLIMGELVEHRPCGVSVVRVKQDGIWHKIGVDRTSLRKIVSTDVSIQPSVTMTVKLVELKTV